MQRFDTAELALHSSPADGWVAVEGQVYDITAFVARHRGGSVLHEVLGTDCTTRIRASHLAKIPRLLANPRWRERHGVRHLGTLDTPAVATETRYGRPVVAYSLAPDPFYELLQARVRRYLRETGEPSFGSLRMVLWPLLPIYLGFAASYYLAYGLGLWPAAILMTFVGGLLPIRIGHPAAHGGWARPAWLRQLGALHFDLFCMSSVAWMAEHEDHHTNTNTRHDTDLRHDPLMRFHPRQRWRPLHRFQHVYVPMLYSVVWLRWVLSSSFEVLRSRQTSAPRKLAHLCVKSLGLFMLFVVPFLLHAPATALACVLIFSLSAGYYTTLLFAVTHVNDEASILVEDDAQRPWAETQVRTSVNWRGGSVLFNLLSGGMNHQIEHHLFPLLDISHYPKIAPIVRQTCAEFGIPYRCAPSYSSLLRSHFRYLHAMGRGWAQKPAD